MAIMDADAVADGILFDHDPYDAAMAPAPTLAPVTPPGAVRGRGEAPQQGPPEHSSYQAPGPTHDVYGPGPVPLPMPTPQHPPYNAQAVGQVPSASKSHLGLTLLALATGTAVGAKMGGVAGAGAGALGAGATVNAVRAMSAFKRGTEAGDKEGRVSTLYALVGGAGAGLLWFKYADPPDESKRKRKLVRNPVQDPDGDDDYGMSERPTPCDIRPVGP